MTPAGRAAVLALLPVWWLPAQNDSPIGIGTIAKDLTFTQGPAWSKDGYLVFSDTPSDRILKWLPGHGVELLRAGAQGPSGMAYDVQGRLYLCETHSRRVTRTEKNGKVEVLAETWEGKRLNAPNGIVVSRTGHVYFTDPAFGEQSDHRELDFYGVYHIPPKGPMKLVARPSGRPNGIALSPGGRVLYVVNSDERNVRAYDVERDGDTAGERVLISGIAGVPGGVCVDEKGNLYIAADGIAVYTAEGRPVRTIEIPVRPSNCTFGETDGDSLFVTARGNVYRLRLGPGLEAQ
jgi:gluconolactonase